MPAAVIARRAGLHAGRSTRHWPWLAAGIPVAAFGAVAGAALTGASAPTLVGDPGAFVRWASPAVGTSIQLAQALTLGGLVMLTFALPGGKGGVDDGGAWRLVRAVTSVAGPVWALLAVVDIVLGYALVAGRPIGAAGFGDDLGVYVSEISTGRAQLVTAAMAAAVAIACAAVSGYRSAMLALVVGVVALIPAATQGHAAGSVHHELGMDAIFGHVLGAAVWTGGLAVLSIAGKRLGRSAHVVVSRFSAVALWCFAIVTVSGLVSAWIRVGSPAALGTRYGLVLVVKITLLMLLGAAGWWHRRRTIADLRQGRGWAFWRLVGAEIALVGLASGLGIALSSSEPPAGMSMSTGHDTTAPGMAAEAAGAMPTSEHDAAAMPLPTESLSQPTPAPEAILTAFAPDVLFGSVAAAMLVVYLGWALALRQRGDHWPTGRIAAWVAGCLVFGYLALGAPAVYGQTMPSVRPAVYLAYLTVVPMLLVSAAPMTLALQAMPARSDGSFGPREWLVEIVHSGWGHLATHRVVAAVVFIATMMAFAFSPWLSVAPTTHLGRIALIGHSVLTGYLFVNGLIGIDAWRRRPVPTHSPA